MGHAGSLRFRSAFRVCAVTISIVLIAGCAGKRDAPESEPTSVADVIARHVAALGGAEALLAGSSRTARGRVDFPGRENAGSFEMHQTRNGDMWMFMEVSGGGEFRSGVVDGVPWRIVSESGEATVLDGEEAAEMLCSARWDAWLFPEDAYVSQELRGQVPFRGEPAFEVHMVGECDLEWTHYFSVADGWLIGSEYEMSSPMGKISVTAHTEYGEFEGGWYPAVDTREYEGVPALTLITESYEIDVAPEHLLEVPPEVRAALDD